MKAYKLWWRTGKIWEKGTENIDIRKLSYLIKTKEYIQWEVVVICSLTPSRVPLYI